MFELMDRVYETIGMYMCNYKIVIDHNGKHHKTEALIEVMSGHLCDEFEKLTGDEYVTSICRGKEEPNP